MKEKDFAEISEKLTELVLRTYYTMRDDTREVGDISVSSHAFCVMMKLYFAEVPYTVNGLSSLMHMHNPQLSKILNLLEDHDFINRVRPKENRRSVAVSLTDEGRAYVEEMTAVFRENIAAALEDKGIAEPSATSRAIERLYSALF